MNNTFQDDSSFTTAKENADMLAELSSLIVTQSSHIKRIIDLIQNGDLEEDLTAVRQKIGEIKDRNDAILDDVIELREADRRRCVFDKFMSGQ
jgi:hypothetical protein